MSLKTVARIEKIETALEPNFQQLFVNAMAMPNKVDAFPELAKVVALPREGAEPTELDAMIAYLQALGQMVDFATFDASGPNLR